MKHLTLVLMLGAVVSAQSADTIESHVAAANALNASTPTALINLCEPAQAARAAGPARRGGQPPAAAAAPATPDRSRWAREPVKVFDNLYYVGEREYSAWALTTPAGIIIIDPIYDYSVEEQVVGGLKKLGLDPTQIKYVVVSHAHRDHAGGAWYLQERFGARVLMTAPDWDLLERNTQKWPKPKRDMVVTDGQQLTLGDTTLTFVHTFGHTPGTMSTILPVRDNGRRHVAALWGGTGFNFTITPERPASHWFDAYIASARRFREAAAKAGADVFLSNHPSWDGSNDKMTRLAARKPGEPHPYVVGAKAVQNHFTIAEHCAHAGKLRAAQAK
ncbi:MAG TPA: MBL fold metallo-hydrolase [Vicinamibacterales bacterium]|nr:MBL fold metallo-hydrolase [Vicinamibacterales bacterium]